MKALMLWHRWSILLFASSPKPNLRCLNLSPEGQAAMNKKNIHQTYRIGFYIRVSTEEQAESPEGSLRSQEHRLREAVAYKNRNGNYGEVRGVFIDPGISAKNMKRPKLQELLAAVRNGEINLIMVTELSRLSRNTRDFIEMWDMMRAHGCRFLSLREDFDTTNAAGELVLFQLMNLAQFERRQTSERVEANIAARASRGLYNGGVVPLGYKIDPEKPGYLFVDPEAVETVRAAFKAMIHHGSVSQTAAWLNDNGFRPKKVTQGGGSHQRLSHFSVGNLHCILRNKAYIGIKSYNHRGESLEAKAVWEPIIDQVLFAKVQKKLEKNNYGRYKPSSDTRFPYTLTGVVVCKVCGEQMVGKSAHGNVGKVGYYEHSWSTRKDSTLKEKRHKCDPQRVPAKKLEPVVWDHLRRFLMDDGFVSTLMEKVRALNAEDPLKLERERVRAKISALESQLEGLAERIAELPKGISAGPLYKQMDKIQSRRTDFEAKLLSLGVDGTKSPVRIVDNLSLDNFRARYRDLLMKGLSETQQRLLVQKFIHKVEVGVDSVTIQFLVDKDHYAREQAVETSEQSGKNSTFDGSNMLTSGPQDWT